MRKLFAVMLVMGTLLAFAGVAAAEHSGGPITLTSVHSVKR